MGPCKCRRQERNFSARRPRSKIRPARPPVSPETEKSEQRRRKSRQKRAPSEQGQFRRFRATGWWWKQSAANPSPCYLANNSVIFEKNSEPAGQKCEKRLRHRHFLNTETNPITGRNRERESAATPSGDLRTGTDSGLAIPCSSPIEVLSNPKGYSPCPTLPSPYSQPTAGPRFWR